MCTAPIANEGDSVVNVSTTIYINIACVLSVIYSPHYTVPQGYCQATVTDGCQANIGCGKDITWVISIHPALLESYFQDIRHYYTHALGCKIIMWADISYQDAMHNQPVLISKVWM